MSLVGQSLLQSKFCLEGHLGLFLVMLLIICKSRSQETLIVQTLVLLMQNDGVVAVNKKCLAKQSKSSAFLNPVCLQRWELRHVKDIACARF